MKKVYLQYWEESDIKDGLMPDGCSLHLYQNDCFLYVREIYSNRNSGSVPEKYDKVVGDCIEISVKESIYDSLVLNNYIKLDQVSLINLIRLKELIP